MLGYRCFVRTISLDEIGTVRMRNISCKDCRLRIVVLYIRILRNTSDFYFLTVILQKNL